MSTPTDKPKLSPLITTGIGGEAESTVPTIIVPPDSTERPAYPKRSSKPIPSDRRTSRDSTSSSSLLSVDAAIVKRPRRRRTSSREQQPKTGLPSSVISDTDNSARGSRVPSTLLSAVEDDETCQSGRRMTLEPQSPIRRLLIPVDDYVPDVGDVSWPIGSEAASSPRESLAHPSLVTVDEDDVNRAHPRERWNLPRDKKPFPGIPISPKEGPSFRLPSEVYDDILYEVYPSSDRGILSGLPASPSPTSPGTLIHPKFALREWAPGEFTPSLLPQPRPRPRLPIGELPNPVSPRSDDDIEAWNKRQSFTSKDNITFQRPIINEYDVKSVEEATSRPSSPISMKRRYSIARSISSAEQDGSRPSSPTPESRGYTMLRTTPRLLILGDKGFAYDEKERSYVHAYDVREDHNPHLQPITAYSSPSEGSASSDDVSPRSSFTGSTRYMYSKGKAAGSRHSIAEVLADAGTPIDSVGEFALSRRNSVMSEKSDTSLSPITPTTPTVSGFLTRRDTVKTLDDNTSEAGDPPLNESIARSDTDKTLVGTMSDSPSSTVRDSMVSVSDTKSIQSNVTEDGTKLRRRKSLKEQPKALKEYIQHRRPRSKRLPSGTPSPAGSPTTDGSSKSAFPYEREYDKVPFISTKSISEAKAQGREPVLEHFYVPVLSKAPHPSTRKENLLGHDPHSFKTRTEELRSALGSSRGSESAISYRDTVLDPDYLAENTQESNSLRRRDSVRRDNSLFG